MSQTGDPGLRVEISHMLLGHKQQVLEDLSEPGQSHRGSHDKPWLVGSGDIRDPSEVT